ncbi:SLC13 family permease [Cellulomonas pakistanensis]|uniref:Cation transporter n=1 Tax=Cellulomonas pakistanensis TaxID=992287 RepID=A0A919U6F6_9CELL|nr:SLC13 family permease [Cellulomonas pakistanensis]GIG36954.1 cation transporter [Cellulomonas pakistanensis]
MPDATLSLIVLGAAVALFVWNRLPAAVVAVLTTLALAATGVLTEQQALAGFGDPVVVFIASLFVLSDGLEASGVTAWAGRQLLAHAGVGRTRVLVGLMGLGAVLAALVTPNGAAAAGLPVLVLVARRAGLAASRLAIPLASAASAGALLTLSGSPVNVIVADALQEATGRTFGFFEFAALGVPLVLVTAAVAVLLGDRLLPDRPAAAPDDHPPAVRTVPDRLGARAAWALGVLVATIALLASGAVTAATAGLLGATAMVLTGATTAPHALRAIPWGTLVLIGGLIPLSVAIAESGAADLLADAVVGVVPEGEGRLLLVALFLLTVALGQFVSNAATVLVVTPIALSAAEAVGIAAEPVLMLVAAAGAASFLTPIATPANMIVRDAGGYRFGDYWRLGLVTTGAWLLVVVALVPVVWPLAPR